MTKQCLLLGWNPKITVTGLVMVQIWTTGTNIHSLFLGNHLHHVTDYSPSPALPTVHHVSFPPLVVNSEERIEDQKFKTETSKSTIRHHFLLLCNGFLTTPAAARRRDELQEESRNRGVRQPRPPPGLLRPRRPLARTVVRENRIRINKIFTRSLVNTSKRIFIWIFLTHWFHEGPGTTFPHPLPPLQPGGMAFLNN